MSGNDGDNTDNSTKTRNLSMSLTPRELAVLKKRFGIDAGSELTEERGWPRCTFCGKSEVIVKQLIKADSGAYICERCIKRYKGLVDSEDDE